MQQLSEPLIQELHKRSKFVIPVVEFYRRYEEDITSESAPANAIGRFATTCFTWTNPTGSYTYDAKVLGFPEVVTYWDSQINTAEVNFGNAKRGEGSMTKFVLDNQIRSMWMVIRLIFPDSPDESIILFWGKCQRPGEINNSTLSITATQAIANLVQTIPFRGYQLNCPLDFARAGGDCLGNQTLAEKSLSFRQAAELYGSAGCNKAFTTCVKLDNSKYFQGQKTVAVSGQFSYVTVEEVVKRILFWKKKKKVYTTHNENWSSVNQSEGDATIPLAFGRCQIQGHPITWADVGEQVKSLQGFCEGKISAFTFIRSRTEGINIVSTIQHLGDWGDLGTQVPDTLFNGNSGYNSKLAYLEIITSGSSNTQVDNAPIITAVIRGLEVPIPGAGGEYNTIGWTNNAVHYLRYLLTDKKFGKLPLSKFDDDAALLTAADCDSLVEDRTNCELVVLPSNEEPNYGVTYRRFSSSGRYTPYKDMYIRNQFSDMSTAEPPEFGQPSIQWYNPFNPPIVPAPQTILRQKFTFNGALADTTPLLDFIEDKMLPTFNGFINYSFNGKLQVKNRQKADNAYLRMDTKYGDLRVPVSNVSAWRRDLSGWIIVGVSQVDAEVREVKEIEYSTACNAMPVTAETIGSLVVTTSGTLEGGSLASPAMGWVQIDGSIVAGDQVAITFNSGDDEFVVGYIVDGIEDLATVTRMITAYFNANLDFQNYLTAYISETDPTKIIIRCESGYLKFNTPLEFPHFEGDEIMRVLAVFENCNELTANTSAQFDNIIADSFKWNVEQEDDINAVAATYTSAVDDFYATQILPRAAWDTIDLEGELKKKDLDLAYVDNYWQAAYLAKNSAIENIDGNLYFSFQTDLRAVRLELGDVVAVRHDSGDSALNYLPVWITSVSTNLDNFTVKVEAKLYLSSAFNLVVSAVDPLLTTTLNPQDYPAITPDPIGGGGGGGGYGGGGGGGCDYGPHICPPDTYNYNA